MKFDPVTRSSNLHKSLNHLLNLTDLEVEGNELESLEFLITTKLPGEVGVAPGTSKVVGRNAPIKVLTLPSLHSLNAGRNKITHMNHGPLVMPKLQELYLNGNRISTIEKESVCYRE